MVRVLSKTKDITDVYVHIKWDDGKNDKYKCTHTHTFYVPSNYFMENVMKMFKWNKMWK